MLAAAAEPSPPPDGGPATAIAAFNPELDSDPVPALTDEILLRIFSHLDPNLRISASLVCKKWLLLLGRLRRSLTLLDWGFLAGHGRRLVTRFPDLTEVDLVPASIPQPAKPSGIVLSHGRLALHLDPQFAPAEDPIRALLSLHRRLSPETADRGLAILSGGCPGLRKLAVVAAATDQGMLAAAANCPTLLELELHSCSDASLGAISAFVNLQVLKLVNGGAVTDIGLTILAHGCKRLVKLDLSGCEGSYDGVSAVGRCCPMLEELTLCDHRMDQGWLAGLPFCGNLKTLRLIGCRSIDKDPGPAEHLGVCPAVEHLHLERCQLRDKRSLNALFYVCGAAKDLFFRDCWGLDDESFALAALCRVLLSRFPLNLQLSFFKA
ncbi:F-box protein At5g51380-like isoform X2 [Wolffia australiana]